MQGFRRGLNRAPVEAFAIDNRTIDEDGRRRTPVGSTVNVDRATYSNTLGDPLMLAFWEDPDFDPAQSAHEITLDRVNGRSFPVRFRDGLARLLTPYL